MTHRLRNMINQYFNDNAISIDNVEYLEHSEIENIRTINKTIKYFERFGEDHTWLCSGGTLHFFNNVMEGRIFGTLFVFVYEKNKTMMYFHKTWKG